MRIQVHPGFFRSLDDALADVRKSGTRPTTFVSGPSDRLHVHWHAHDVRPPLSECRQNPERP